MKTAQEVMTLSTDRGTILYKNELVRKGIHMCSLAIPVIYYFISRELALTLLVPVTIFSLAIDLSRYYFPRFGKVFYRYFGFLLREHEMDQNKKNLSGASYVFISAALVIFIFPKVIAITAFAVLIVSDVAAALVGRKWGKHKFLMKSFEGTFSFFISACIIVLFAPKITNDPMEYVIGVIAVAVGAIAENISYGWADDNLTIPLSIGGVMWLLYILLLPEMELILSGVPV